MYKKRGEYTSFDEYVKFKTGYSLNDLNLNKTFKLRNIQRIVDAIMHHIHADNYIVVYADYDADGIDSAVQFESLLTELGAKKLFVYVPRRFSDGYGIKQSFVSRLKSMSKGLLITVDNGISAIDEIKAARSYGWDVIIMDHHLGAEGDNGIVVPRANIILDPECIAEGNDFTKYCGAGLTYKLGEEMLGTSDLLSQMSAFAAIGTVCDAVEMTGDNRQIVKSGLTAMNTGKTTMGLRKLIDVADLTGHVTSSDLAFQIGPMLNAMARVYDQGGASAKQALLCNDEELCIKAAAQIKSVNDYRKQITKEAIEKVNVDATDAINFIQVDASEGLLGLIAAKLQESTGKPTFVYAEAANGVCKGSARSDSEGTNNIKEMLDSCRKSLLGYGGHAGAAGFSFDKALVDSIHKSLSSYPIKPVPSHELYDLEYKAQDLPSVFTEFDSAEPFGHGFESPTIKVICHFNQPEYWHALGKDGSHIRFDLPNGISAIAFGMKEQYMKDKTPKDIALIGELNWNWYKGQKKPQVLVQEIEKL